MELDEEVRHASEDIDPKVLADVVNAIRRRVRKVSRDYDVPYIAGCSRDGHTVFTGRRTITEQGAPPPDYPAVVAAMSRAVDDLAKATRRTSLSRDWRAENSSRRG